MSIELIFPAILSFVTTAIFIPPTVILAKKFNLLDNPKIRPHPAHIHQRIIPRAGGLPCLLGLTLSIIFFIPLIGEVIGILVALWILLLVGLMDDKYQNLSPYFRLAGQFAAATFAVTQGLSIQFVTSPFGGIIQFNAYPYLANILAVLWIVWVLNMINWSKGVDGQMPGIVAVSAIILGLLSLKLALLGDQSQINVTKLSFTTAGGALGLLIFNWYPAKILPGFSGSGVLGFMIASLAILSGAKLATAILVLLIPATDFAYTFFRRILSGKSPVWGDRGHLHHKLLEAGLTHPQISLFYILGSVILGTAALSLSSQGKLFAAILLGIILLGTILWLNFFGGYLKRRAPDNG